jgi:hypothetical protein
MANFISFCDNDDNSESFTMSNGATSVFISVLVISGSLIAKTEREKELIIWLAEHDQSIRGVGTVGFSIDDLPWTKNGFKNEKSFLLEVIKVSQLKIGWNILEYKLNEEHIFLFLDNFNKMISKFNEDCINEEKYTEWIKLWDDPEMGMPIKFSKCTIHETYLSWAGCIICNE